MTALRRVAPFPFLLLLLLGVLALLALSFFDTARAQTPAQTVPVFDDSALLPDGLSDGDQLPLLFVTSRTRDATDADVGCFNHFEQYVVARPAVDGVVMGYSGGFRAVVSAVAADVRDNASAAGAGVPIYWLGGFSGNHKVTDADSYDSERESRFGWRSAGHSGTSVTIAALTTGHDAQIRVAAVNRTVGHGAGPPRVAGQQ